jgi:phage tail sheath protein FI
MVFSVSPSVTVREVDLTTTIPAITTPPAAFVGPFRWGPVNERVLITSENDLVTVFGKPHKSNAFTNVETFFTAADFLAYSNALYVTRVVSNTAATAVGIDSANNETFASKYPGELGNSLELAYVVVPSSGDISDFETEIFVTGNILSSTVAIGSNIIEIETLDNIDIDEDLKTGDILRIESTEAGFQDLVITDIDKVTSNTAYTYTITCASRYSLSETDLSNTTISRRWRYASQVDAAPEANSMHLFVIDRDGIFTNNPGQVIERYINLSLDENVRLADGTNNYYKDVLENTSNYIIANETNSVDPGREYFVLTGGSDGLGENAGGLFSALARGYDLYKEANEIDISFVLQGKAVSANLPNYIVSNIVEYRKDCMAFISPKRSDVVDVATPQTKLQNVLNFRSELQNSSYWFMDSGYKYRYDKYNDQYHWVPLNGDMAGLASRVEPWESPAGFRKGLIRNVIKLAFNPNKAQRDQLYGKDINPVITQTGQGTILFGDKTGLGTFTGSAFTRINVRRLFITIEKAIATISAQFLFEFNDEFTQNQFKLTVEPLLRDIQGRRGITDYRVISDGTVNTPDVIDRNIFRANIFVKPARAINFIELTFVATRTGIEFEEIIGLQF